MSEPGFEVARAYASVVPDASDFPSLLDEQIGGLTISVAVTPNASDFASAFDEAAGGLTLSVAVTPDASDFPSLLDESVGGLSVSVAVTPDATDFASALDEQAGGITVPVTMVPEASGASDLGDAVSEQAGTVALPVTPVPDAAGFEDALAEEAGGITVSVRTVPDATDFQEQLDEQVGTPVVGVSLQATAANMAEHIADSLTGSIPVPVVPNMADFADAVQEEAGGVVASVDVVPSASSLANFEAKVQELAGALEVGVTVVPATGEFEEDLQSAAAGESVTVPVTADTSGLQESLAAVSGELQQGVFGLSELEAEEALAAAEADYLASRAAAATGSVSGLSEAAEGAAGAAQDAASGVSLLGEQAVSAAGSVAGLMESAESAAAAVSGIQASSAAASLEETGSAAEEAAAGASDLAGQSGALQDQLTAVRGTLSDLSNAYLGFSGSMSATSEAVSAASHDLDVLQTQYGYVAGAVRTFNSEMAGMDAGAAEEGLGTLSSLMGQLQANVSTTEEAFSSWADRIGAAGAAAAGAAPGVDLVAASLSSIGNALPAAAEAADGVESVARSAGDLGSAAPAASDAASGLSGVLGELAGRMSYMAVDPFMWMYAAPVVIDGVSDAVKALGDNTMGLVTELAAQDDATGYNVTGYKELSTQLSATATHMQSLNSTVTTLSDSVGKGLGSISGTTSDVNELDAASQQYATDAQNLAGHLGDLGNAYGITQQQAGLLADAAGATGAELDTSGQAAIRAMEGVQNYATANLTASKAVTQLTQDQEVFSSGAFTATARIGDLDNAFATLAGNFISVQTAQLNVTGGFDNLEAAAQAAGATMTGTNTQSVGLQQSFYAMAGTIEQAANAMVQQGDSAQTVTGYINTQVTALSQYEGGNKNASLAVQDLKKWEDSLTGSLETQGSYLATTLSNDLDQAILNYSGVQTAVNDYANALVDFGKNSPQAQNAQDLLTDSIVKGGLAAGQSTTQIATMISQMEKIPLKEAIQITLNAEGQYSVSESAELSSAASQLTAAGMPATASQVKSALTAGMAEGGYVTGGSGLSRADDIHAMLSHGEYVVQASAVSRYGTGFLDDVNAGHFADGGAVTGSYSGSPSGMGAWLGSQYNSTNTMLIQAVEAATAAAAAAGEAAAAVAAASASQGGSGGEPPLVVNFNGTQYPTPEQNQAIMTELSALIGVS